MGIKALKLDVKKQKRRVKMKITMSSKEYIVSDILKKTKAQMFEDIEVGDSLMFSVPIDYAGGNRGTYATYIECCNVSKGNVTHKSFNELPQILSYFVLVGNLK